MKYTYLFVDAGTIFVPLLFSFHRRIDFASRWKTFFPAAALVATLFLIWDDGFTRAGVWGFNPHYVVGLYIGRLPVEEFLFFICIPYACVFTYHAWDLFYSKPPHRRTAAMITLILGIVLLTAGAVNWHRRYTAATFLSLGALLIICRYFWRIAWLHRFYIVWLFLLLPLVVVDGILTGTGLQQPVVWYDPADILGVRILTIPIEDLFYGMELILLNLLVLSWIMPDHKIKQPG